MFKKIAKVAATFSGIMLISKLLSIFFLVYTIAVGFAPNESASIGIIGGADGPTALFLANEFLSIVFRQLLGPILLFILEILAYLFVFTFSVKAVRNSK